MLMSRRRSVLAASVVTLSLALSGCGTVVLPSAQKNMGAGMSCYWMTPDGSRWELQPDVQTKRQCFELDSCSGGQGASGGGCYKWAPMANAKAEPW
jgi:hypothetical protein